MQHCQKDWYEIGQKKKVEGPLSDKGADVERTETVRTPNSSVLGETIATTGIARDISEREQAEEALSESGNKYRTVFETTGTATILVEEDTTISLVNVEFEKLSGFLKEEVEGKKSFSEFIADDDRERLLQYHHLRRIDPSAAPREYEARVVDRKLNVKDVIFTVGMIPGTTTSVASILDITDRKRAENALRKSEERFRSLTENSPTGVFIIQDGHVVYHNTEQERLFGRGSPQKIVDFSRIHPDDAEGVRALYCSMLSEEGRKCDIDFRFYPCGES